MDRASVLGITLGVAAIISGNIFDGGKLASILHMTAALIVFGGTAGATMLSFPLEDIGKAVRSLGTVFSGKRTDMDFFVKEIVRYSTISRKNGLIALDWEISQIESPFLRKALRLAVDGIGREMLWETMQQENSTFEEEQKRIARVFETAGGFAPTIGIIGAVLGLIQVMENLSDPSKLGAGIAVAFVATIYGVGVANLLLLPVSKKLLNRLKYELQVRDMMLEGVMGILSGINPHYLEERLKVFIEDVR